MPDVYSRRKGTPKPPKGAEYVGRGTPWGNPFPMKNESDRARVCRQFREQIAPTLDVRLLIGKDLVCWCTYPGQTPKKECHATILLIAARELEEKLRKQND